MTAALFPLALLFLAGALTAPAEGARREEKEPQKEDYYSPDNWYGNFFKSFKIWSKELRYTNDSAKTVAELGKEFRQDGWR